MSREKLALRGGVALGLLPLAIEGRSDPHAAVVRAAVEADICLLDTADVYGVPGDLPGYAEEIIALALADLPAGRRPAVATKGGMVRTAGGDRRPDGRPEHLRRACEQSLRRLAVAAIDLYQLHQPDPRVPYGDSIGALRDLLDAGTVRAVGVSNVTVDQVRVAQSVLGPGLRSVQNRFSVDVRDEAGVLAYCLRQGLAFLAWAPLGGAGRAATLLQRAPALGRVAARHGVSPHRVALAWVCAQGHGVIPVVGARTVRHVRDAAAAAGLELTAEDLTALDASDSGTQA
ncbi:MAG: aldo/keto reductase [Egibacteraceae bacterium]